MDESDDDRTWIPVHDVRNHLTTVLGFVRLCLEADAAGRRPERSHLEAIERSAELAAKLIRRPPLSEDAGG